METESSLSKNQYMIRGDICYVRPWLMLYDDNHKKWLPFHELKENCIHKWIKHTITRKSLVQ